MKILTLSGVSLTVLNTLFGRHSSHSVPHPPLAGPRNFRNSLVIKAV